VVVCQIAEIGLIGISFLRVLIGISYDFAVYQVFQGVFPGEIRLKMRFGIADSQVDELFRAEGVYLQIVDRIGKTSGLNWGIIMIAIDLPKGASFRKRWDLIWKLILGGKFKNPFIVIFILGLIMLIISELPIDPHLAHILSSIGISFIAVALTAPISNYFQFRTLAEHMRIVQGADFAGITNIMASRLDDEKKFNDLFISEFADAKQISLCGIAFPRLFLLRPFPQQIQHVMYESDVPIRILLLNPDGDSARERSDIEVDRNTMSHITSSIATFASIMKERAKNLHIDITNLVNADRQHTIDIIDKIRMQVHLYDFPPIAFMLLTNKSLLIEQYHFGRPDTCRPGDCIGGMVPVIAYTSTATAYSLMSKHFNYVWDKKSDDITLRLLTD